MKTVLKTALLFAMLFATALTHAQYNAGTNSGTTGTERTFVGANAGAGNAGTFNTFIGQDAGRYNISGSYNTFIGRKAGRSISGQGSANTFLGHAAGYSIKTGGANTFIGASAGVSNTDGARNTFIGLQAGKENKNGTDNVFLGHHAGYNEMRSNRLYIDNNDTDFPLIYGDFSKDELTVFGNLDIRPTSGSNSLDLICGGTGGWNNQIRFFSPNELRHVITDDYTNNWLTISPGIGLSAEKLVYINGAMQIGAVDVNRPAGYQLYVKDGILSEKVKVATVNSADWADYVFAEDYDLNSIEEVEQFVKTNQHLPNVPSAKQVEKNGVDMVEMDATLLRQVEELWLHTIELNERIAELETQLNK